MWSNCSSSSESAHSTERRGMKGKRIHQVNEPTSMTSPANKDPKSKKTKSRGKLDKSNKSTPAGLLPADSPINLSGFSRSAEGYRVEKSDDTRDEDNTGVVKMPVCTDYVNPWDEQYEEEALSNRGHYFRPDLFSRPSIISTDSSYG